MDRYIGKEVKLNPKYDETEFIWIKREDWELNNKHMCHPAFWFTNNGWIYFGICKSYNFGFLKDFSDWDKFNENEPSFREFDHLMSLKPNFYKLIEKRISVVHDYQVDDRVILFLCWICRTPHICVMYCWYLQYESKKHNTQKISFELFAEIFGSGFPSEEALNKMWMQQQVIIEGNNSDNLLDYPKAGLSLFKNYVYEAN